MPLEQSVEQKQRNWKKYIWIIVLAILLIIIGGNVYRYILYKYILTVGEPCSVSGGQVIFCPNSNLSEWQTYRNEEYGFEFRYPNDWMETRWGLLTIDKEFAHIANRTPHDFTGVCKIVFHDQFSVESWIQEIKDADEDSKISTSTVKLQNRSGTKVVSNLYSDVFNYYIPLDEKVTLSISLNCGDDVRERGITIFNQILSTFRFLK